ncbi:MAG: hypothetical protein WC254_01585 [Candidatus Woesearchaeota archaeon]|jgi:hypothetical protein
MKKIIVTLLICLLCIAPFTAAESLSSMINTYDNAKQEFNDLKTEYQDCQKTGNDCSDIEEDMIGPAIDYATAGINIMIMYLEYAGIENGKTDLQTAINELKYAETKEEFDAAITKAKTAWESVADEVKQKTIVDLKSEIADLVEKGKLIDAKLKCGIDNLPSSTSELNNAYNIFSTNIDEADSKITQAENLISANNFASALIAIKEAQQALQDSRTSLGTATNALSLNGGELCAEVIIEETTEEEINEEEPEEEETTPPVETADLEELLSDYDLDSYYNDAQDAMDNLVDYISGKEDDGYDTSEAETVLAEAQDYMDSAEDLILNSAGIGAISKLLNAQQTAERGLNSAYYTISSSSTSTSSSADYTAFTECMESAGYAYQKEACYEDYSISSDTMEEIDTCLDSASSEGQRMDCYESANEEAETQIVADEEELNDRIDAVEEQLHTIEDDVTDLYDELSATGEDSSNDDYRDVDTLIDSLLSDVQSSKEDYAQTIEDIEQDIEDEQYDDADDALDSLEDDVDEFVDDITNEIEDIQQEISAL